MIRQVRLPEFRILMAGTFFRLDFQAIILLYCCENIGEVQRDAESMDNAFSVSPA
jgi:hypothetical protein